ncbi:MAG: hypothetical protein R6V14_04040 [Halanaerobiales bacterium]
MSRLHKNPDLIEPIRTQFGVDYGELNRMYDTYIKFGQQETERYVRR